MQAEQLYESLLTATKLPGAKGDDDLNAKEERKTNLLSQFTITFGNDEGEDATTFNGTIPQALMMMNGQMTKDATSVANGSILQWLSQNASTNEAIEYLYMAALARKPSSADLGMCREVLSTRGNALSAYQDIWWALLNSNEFIFVH
jgi:hypothetical protein